MPKESEKKRKEKKKKLKKKLAFANKNTIAFRDPIPTTLLYFAE